jgi:hypothetical protein
MPCPVAVEDMKMALILSLLWAVAVASMVFLVALLGRLQQIVEAVA